VPERLRDHAYIQRAGLMVPTPTSAAKRWQVEGTESEGVKEHARSNKKKKLRCEGETYWRPKRESQPGCC